MPIGNLLERVTKLVSPATSSGGKNSSIKNRDEQDGAQLDSTTQVGKTDSSSNTLAGGVPPTQPAGRDDQEPAMKRSSEELSDRPASARGDNSNNSQVNKKLPNSIRTSRLSAGNPQLSVTPATPVSPASPASTRGYTGKETRFAKNNSTPTSSTSSTPSSPQKSQEDKNPLSGVVMLSEEQNRNSSLRKGKSNSDDQQEEGDHNFKQEEDSSSNVDSSNIVLEEPEQMNEEEERGLLESEKKQKEAAGSHSSSRYQSVNEDDNEEDTKSHNYNANESADEDHPDMPPPHAPRPDQRQQEQRPKKPSLLDRLPSEVISDSPSNSPTTPHDSSPWSSMPSSLSKPWPPKPSMLDRLPSQVISESPGSENPPSPEEARNDYSLRNSSGDAHGLGAHFLRANGESKSDDVDNDAQHKGAQGHLPHMLANAVQDLSGKLAKGQDYGFPARAEPEEQSEAPTCESPQSEKGDPMENITASPPSFSLLDPGHMNRFGSPTSSVRSGSSINEYSTPAGFMKHRRNSSQNAPRQVKETPNAGYQDLPDGKRKLNQYILTSDIGRGSFGVVQIAKDEVTGQEYAAKEFSKLRLRKRQQSEMIRRQAKGSRRGAVPMRSRTTSERIPTDPTEASKKDLDLIRSEVAIMKKLDHPNVVKLFEVLDVQQDDCLFMIVELCREGPIMNISMGQTVKPIEEDTARNFFRQMILAIEYLHENGIIHRDIKPENILKMSDGQSIKLVDFGVSEMFSREDEQRELRTSGSPAFMAPELCVSGHTKVSGKATDIWALGVTLYCMVVGHLPFESHQMLDLYDKIKSDPVNMPETLSIDLKDLIVRLLEKDPDKRIRMDELREHPWVTCGGKDPLPSKEMNVTSVEEVTEHDIATAIAVPSVSYIVNAVRAAGRWRRFAARRTQSDSAHSDCSTVSTEMSRSASNEVTEALQLHRDSNLKDNASSSSRHPSSSDKGNNNTQEKEIPATEGTKVINHDALKAVQAKCIGTKDKEATHQKHGSTSSTSSNSSLSELTNTIKPALSFPQSVQGGREKRPEIPTPPEKKIESIIDFPEVDRHLSQQEYLSNTGIDDSSVEMLRHYEDTTGHMLPRSAVDDIVKARRQSPLPRNNNPRPKDRQTAKGPSPP